MINPRIERFLKKEKLTISPRDYNKSKEESYTKRKFGSPVYYFHDAKGIQHYLFKNKDYRRKTLIVKIGFDKNGEYPSFKRIINLKNIIRKHTDKKRILVEKTIKTRAMYEIKYEILFTSNNNLKSFQYWIDELAYMINDNTIILLEELSLDVCSNPQYKKILPDIKTNQFENKNIKPLNENLDKLNDFELATIAKEYEKEKILPPYDLALDLELDSEFFEENKEYYKNSRLHYAEDFFEKIRKAEIVPYFKNNK